MSTASPHDRTCAGCGAPVDTRNQPCRQRGDEVLCLICERSYLTADRRGADAALQIIEAAVGAALNGHASPQDIAAVVARAIQRTNTGPTAALDMVGWKLQMNRKRLDEVGSVISKREAS